MKVSDYKDLVVWQKSVDNAVAIYQAVKEFPAEEKFGLSNQMKRAAVSISSNIAEGACRRSRKEFIHFLHVALGSASELETQIIIAEKLGFLSDNTLIPNALSIRKMIHGLIGSLSRNNEI